MSERIGIMGGMFDPVHVGHIRVALAALRQLQLDQIRLVPCGIPNHRDQALCSSLQRLEMLALAVSEHPQLVVDDRELNRPGTSYTYDTLRSLRQEFAESQLFFILGVDAFASLPTWHRWRELFDFCHFVVIERPGFDLKLPDQLRAEVLRRRVAGSGSLLKDIGTEGVAGGKSGTETPGRADGAASAKAEGAMVESAKEQSANSESLKREGLAGLIFDMQGLDSPVSSTEVRERIANDAALESLVNPAVADYLHRHQLYKKAVIDNRHSDENAN